MGRYATPDSKKFKLYRKWYLWKYNTSLNHLTKLWQNYTCFKPNLFSFLKILFSNQILNIWQNGEKLTNVTSGIEISHRVIILWALTNFKNSWYRGPSNFVPCLYWVLVFPHLVRLTVDSIWAAANNIQYTTCFHAIS